MGVRISLVRSLDRERRVSTNQRYHTFRKIGPCLHQTVWPLSLPPLLTSLAPESSAGLCLSPFFAGSIWGLQNRIQGFHGRIGSFPHEICPGGILSQRPASRDAAWGRPGAPQLLAKPVAPRRGSRHHLVHGPTTTGARFLRRLSSTTLFYVLASLGCKMCPLFRSSVGACFLLPKTL